MKETETRALIDKHQNCIEILEAISHFHQMKKHANNSINGFAGVHFPDLKAKYIHNIDIYNRCVARLEQRHNKLISGVCT